MIDCSISIIIPAYNVEKYLKAALDSIRAQEQHPDEVIVIDDGSTDQTLEIAKSYSFPFPFKVATIKNGGQGNARNLGISMASSEYVYFFDSDDLLTRNLIRSVKASIRQHCPDIILFSGESFNDSEYQGDRWLDYRRGFSGLFDDRTLLLDKGYSNNGLFCTPCLYVTKKSLWGPEGLEFGPDFLEDDTIFYPLLFACHTFLVIDEVYFLRRNREGSTMTMKPNANHVNGALNCIQTNLNLYTSSRGLTPREQWHIRKRLESNCSRYIVMARRAGLSVKLSEVLSTILKVKSPKLAIRTFLFGIRADQSDTVRSVGRMVKRIGNFIQR